MRLTEWLDDKKTRAHIKPDNEVTSYDVYTRLAQYEDIGTVIEFAECRADSKRFLKLAEMIWDYISKKEDDGK